MFTNYSQNYATIIGAGLTKCETNSLKNWLHSLLSAKILCAKVVINDMIERKICIPQNLFVVAVTMQTLLFLSGECQLEGSATSQ